MLVAERQNAMMALLEKEGSISVKKIAATLYVSEATVRRDLHTMETEGLLRRSHGGAVLLEKEAGEASFFVRREENTAKKRQIAEAVLPHLSGATFFLDSSSTVRALAAVWDATGKTVITTGVETAWLFSRKKETCVILPGGEMRYLAGSVLGSMAMRQIEQCHADVFLCSCGGISPDGEVSETVAEQGEMKAAMLRRSTRHILLCDGSKIGRHRAFAYARLSHFDMLVTDRRPDTDFCRLCRESGVELLYPGRIS